MTAAHASAEGLLAEPLRNHLRSLESIFGDPQLRELRAKTPEHPASVQYAEIVDYLAQGLPYPDDVDIARSVTSAILDRTVWIAPVGGDPWEMLPDNEAKRQVRNRVRNPQQFNDTMAEVFFWSWLRSKGLAATLVEVEGKPDICVALGEAEEIWIEVKRIRLGTTASRVRKVIKKASSQIKMANESRSGVVFISLERAVARAALDEKIPSDVDSYIAEARRELASGHSRHVGKVVICWDDLLIDVAVGSDIQYNLRRRSVILAHDNPVEPPRLDSLASGLDIAVQLSGPWPSQLGQLTGHGPRLSANEFVVGPGFREFNAATDGVRPHHAIEAAIDPDAEYRRTLGGGTDAVSIVTRRVTAARNPYTLLLLIRNLKDGRREIGEAYKLYHDQDGRLSRDPVAAFYAFIDLFGAPIGLEAGDSVIWARMFWSARVNTKSRAIRIALPADGGDYTTGATAISFQENPPGFVVDMAYAVDLKKYRADISKESARPKMPSRVPSTRPPGERAAARPATSSGP